MPSPSFRAKQSQFSISGMKLQTFLSLLILEIEKRPIVGIPWDDSKTHMFSPIITDEQLEKLPLVTPGGSQVPVTVYTAYSQYFQETVKNSIIFALGILWTNIGQEVGKTQKKAHQWGIGEQFPENSDGKFRGDAARGHHAI